MTEEKAAPAAAEKAAPVAASSPVSQVRESDSRNLVMRVAVAAVMIPLAVAIAYAGGWLWAALVTLAAIGLFVEWLAIVGLAGVTRVTPDAVQVRVISGKQ